MTASAFVLAAGFGTRLQPLTLHRPKPLVPLCGVPALAYSLALCARYGLHDVVVNAHYLADQLATWNGEHEGVRVHVHVETPDILGTGGGLRAVRDQLDERFVVLNADVLHDVDLAALLTAVPEGGGAMALRPHADDATRYGIVAADATGIVAELTTVAEATPRGVVQRDTHFTGIHALDRRALERVPDGFACIVRTAYKQLVPERRVGSVRHPGVWLDAGDPAAYLETNLDLLHERVTLALDPRPRAAVHRSPDGAGHGATHAALVGPVWVGDGAHLGAEVTLDATIVGDRATVPDGTTLRRCVVWDGVTVPPGTHEDTVFFADDGSIAV